jgi:hypothetical protein
MLIILTLTNNSFMLILRSLWWNEVEMNATE